MIIMFIFSVLKNIRLPTKFSLRFFLKKRKITLKKKTLIYSYMYAIGVV